VLVRDYLARKSEADPDGTMSFFSRDRFTCVDAELGWSWHGWDTLRAGLFQFMPNWPKNGKSCPVRIPGGSNSAICSSLTRRAFSGHPKPVPWCHQIQRFEDNPADRPLKRSALRYIRHGEIERAGRQVSGGLP
jgi:hypothetical protein